MPTKLNTRTYRIADKNYFRAKERGEKKKQLPLSNILEKVATAYGHGFDVIIMDKNGQQESLTNPK